MLVFTLHVGIPFLGYALLSTAASIIESITSPINSLIKLFWTYLKGATNTEIAIVVLGVIVSLCCLSIALGALSIVAIPNIVIAQSFLSLSAPAILTAHVYTLAIIGTQLATLLICSLAFLALLILIKIGCDINALFNLSDGVNIKLRQSIFPATQKGQRSLREIQTDSTLKKEEQDEECAQSVPKINKTMYLSNPFYALDVHLDNVKIAYELVTGKDWDKNVTNPTHVRKIWLEKIIAPKELPKENKQTYKNSNSWATLRDGLSKDADVIPANERSRAAIGDCGDSHAWEIIGSLKWGLLASFGYEFSAPNNAYQKVPESGTTSNVPHSKQMETPTSSNGENVIGL